MRSSARQTLPGFLTFIDEEELWIPVVNFELNQLVDKLKVETKRDWRLREKTVRNRFLPWKTEKRYCLYVHFRDIEWRAMRFNRHDLPIQFVNSEVILAFAYGFLDGMKLKSNA